MRKHLLSECYTCIEIPLLILCIRHFNLNGTGKSDATAPPTILYQANFDDDDSERNSNSGFELSIPFNKHLLPNRTNFI